MMRLELPFPNSPIAEAILDIRCNLPPGTEMSTLAEVHERIKDRFPTRQEQNKGVGNFPLNSDDQAEATTTSGKALGYQCATLDGAKFLQVQFDGFTLNKLKPYKNWDAFITEAKTLWSIYTEITNSINVTRISIRYINRIEIPIPIKELKDWLLTCPDIAPGCPQEMAGFFMRVVLPDPTRQNTGILTETVEAAPSHLRYLPIIFDLDVFRDAVFAPGDPDMWDAFVSLRETRDSIFFNSITDKTRDLFR